MCVVSEYAVSCNYRAPFVPILHPNDNISYQLHYLLCYQHSSLYNNAIIYLPCYLLYRRCYLYNTFMLSLSEGVETSPNLSGFELHAIGVICSQLLGFLGQILYHLWAKSCTTIDRLSRNFTKSRAADFPQETGSYFARSNSRSPYTIVFVISTHKRFPLKDVTTTIQLPSHCLFHPSQLERKLT